MNAHGYALEAALEAQHARGRTGFRACFAARSGVDFVGWALVGGVARPVVMEAKAHSGDGSWSMDSVSAEQAAQLDAAANVGALALVVLAAWGRVWALPWGQLPESANANRRRTVRPGEVASVGFDCVGYDWLSEVA